MIWTGVLLLAFIVGHLFHFTFQVISPDTAALTHLVDGTPNVMGMVVSAFQNFFTALIYCGAMVVLFLHLSHGIQSFFQTMGWSNDRVQPFITKAGTVVALVLLVGYAAVPFFILVSFLK
jgi:succinate dehydrogenase / fumarate reductase cytochrome b subunit